MMVNPLTKFAGNDEWYTPSRYIEMAREVMGIIDTDPASNNHAQATVRATTFYTEANSGLDKPWGGRVWMNPPYSRGLIRAFIDKLVAEFSSGRVTEAVVLTNNTTNTAWAARLFQHAAALCFTAGRIKFESPTGRRLGPPQGQLFTYLGQQPDRFATVFATAGHVVVLHRLVAANDNQQRTVLTA